MPNSRSCNAKTHSGSRGSWTVGVLRAAVVTLAFTFASGCGDEDSAPSSCDPSAAVGTYWIDWTTIAGNCGDISPGLIFVSSTPTVTCMLLEPDRTSENGCKNEAHFRCAYEDGSEGEFVSVLRMLDSNGDALSGTVTVLMESAFGNTCNGSYRVTYVRQ